MYLYFIFTIGINNIEFHRGDAAKLPFGDASFDLVVTRLAIHHFDKPATIVHEMARVCKPGGRVILVDITSVDDPVQVKQ